jgi:UDP-N-acetylmuramate dehydrogenase
MLNIQKNISLKNYNTFGIEAIASTFVQINTQEEFRELASIYNNLPKPIYILGSGANTLFTKDFKGTIININNKGIKLLHEDKNEVIVEVQAGEIWNDLVEFCVNNNYYGIENLVAIPSTVGASAIQNIGAYGMEAKDSIFKVKYIDLQTFKTIVLNNNECEFGYRNSIFKNKLEGKVIILSVLFKFYKNAKLKLSYGSILDELKHQNITSPTLEQITTIIRNIRNSKLPDPKIIGNAGSFFKNPIIDNIDLEILKVKFPKIVYYPINENKSKLAAAWLIENANLKGFQKGGAAVHKNQSLVIINKDSATSSDIVELSKYIQQKIKSLYNINLYPEVIFI